ncbi:MAG: hypothetical protein M3037_10915 [Gemmatimonadota bacterium]|nr:hypothetical protein [Gemmatimonadota bacterium]
MARKGFALAAAILAVVLIGALVAGVLFAATEETRAGAVEVDRLVALDACEAAVAMIITDPGLQLPRSIGVEGAISGRIGGLGPEVVVYITRLDSALYSILAETPPKPGSRAGAHRVGVVVKSSIAADGSITIDPISERPWFEVF